MLCDEPYPEVNNDHVLDILKELSNSEKQLILCGGGVVSSDSLNELVVFSEKYHIPIASTLRCLEKWRTWNRIY